MDEMNENVSAYPRHKLTVDDAVMDEGHFSVFLPFGLEMDEDKMVSFMWDNPVPAAGLCSYRGGVYFADGSVSRGVRYVDGRVRSVVEGKNECGRFIARCRERYLRELGERGAPERPPRRGQVTADYFIRDEMGSMVSAIDLAEGDFAARDEESPYLHVNPWRPRRYRPDAALNGTTGHAGPAFADGVRFHTFVSPFGRGRGYLFQASSEAEASFLYEQALRGDLDWRSYVAEMVRSRRLKGVDEKAAGQIIEDFSAQFAWMRETILRDGDSLRGKTIVADSLVPGDMSLGRSAFDYVFAPGPAHVLARYVNNPWLLLYHSPNGVLRALGAGDKNEKAFFSFASDDEAFAGKTVTVVVDGSDTIGGRTENSELRRTRSTKVRRDERGNVVYGRRGKEYLTETKDVYEMKGRSEAERDYEAFSARLEKILAGIPDEVNVRFVTGGRLGVPKMVERFVADRGGAVLGWDYFKKEAYALKDGEGEGARFSVVNFLRGDFDLICPVLCGREESVVVSGNDEDAVTFDKGDVRPAGVVDFSVPDDSHDVYDRTRASVLVSGGLPLIRVFNVYGERQQADMLSLYASLSLSSLAGAPGYADSLFEGKVREAWGRGDILSSSFLGEPLDGAAYVHGYPFKTIYGYYSALALQREGLDSDEAVRSLSAAEGGGDDVVGRLRDLRCQAEFEAFMEGRHGGLADLRGQFVASRMAFVRGRDGESAMRSAVHAFAMKDESFADRLVSSGESVLVVGGDVSGPDGPFFVSRDGKGENRLGVILAAERQAVAEMRGRIEAEMRQEQQKALEAGSRAIGVQRRRRAPVAFAKGGLPASQEDSGGSVWFLGTARPGQLYRSEYDPSVAVWRESYDGGDALCRSVASRLELNTEGGVKIPNKFVYLYPSDLFTLNRGFLGSPGSTSRDLTGLKRVNPATGEEFVCAFGVATKINPYDNEASEDRRFVSYFKGNDVPAVQASLVMADANARAMALEQGMGLAYSVFVDKRGAAHPYLARVFEKDAWLPDADRAVTMFFDDGGRRVGLDAVFDDVFGKPHRVIFSALNSDARDQEVSCSFVGDGDRRVPLRIAAVYGRDSAGGARLVVRDAAANEYECRLMAASGGGGEEVMCSVKARGGRRMVDLRFQDAKGNVLAASLPAYGKADVFLVRMDASYDVREKMGVRHSYRSSPHANAACHDLIMKYVDVLEQNRLMPLNCVPLPKADYSEYERKDDMSFRRDLSLSLSLANALAVRTGGRLVFPLARDGRIDFGPNVPAFLRDEAEEEVMRFFGLERKAVTDAWSLPLISQSAWGSVGLRDSVRSQYTLKASADALVAAFGAFDASPDVSSFFLRYPSSELNKLPIHRMDLMDGDGNGYVIMGMSRGHYSDAQRRAMLERRYGGELVFRVYVPEGADDAKVVSCLNAYVERAGKIAVETRLVTDDEIDGREPEGHFLKGHVVIPSSNARDVPFADDAVLVREMTFSEIKEAYGSNDYPGWVDARDGFEGFVQYRYALPDGFRSEWKTIEDFGLAKDVALLKVGRMYASDDDVVPTAAYAVALLRHEAVKDAGGRFRSLSFSDVDLELLGEKAHDMENAYADTMRSLTMETERYHEPELCFAWAGNDFLAGEGALRVALGPLPGGGEDGCDFVFSSACPPEGLDDEFRSGRISFAEYGDRYRKALEENADAIFKGIAAILDEKRDSGCVHVYFIGAGEPGKASSRYVFLDWLKAKGYDAGEEAHDEALGSGMASQSVNVWASSGENAELSNLAVRPFEYSVPDGRSVAFQSVEQAFQYMKTYYSGGDVKSLSGLRASILRTVSGSALRSLGRAVPFLDVARWDSDAAGVMRSLIESSFRANPEAASALLATAGRTITHRQEKSRWGKEFPRILMEVRDVLGGDEAVRKSLAAYDASRPKDIIFEVSDGGYAGRTRENALASDVDYTVAFATDFSTRGERLVREVAGKAYVPVSLVAARDGSGAPAGLDLSRDRIDSVVQSIINGMRLEHVMGAPVGLNIVGSGICALSKSGVSQKDIDAYMCLIGEGLRRKGIVISSVRTGGQSGVDEAGAVMGRALGLHTVVRAPAGWTYRDCENRDISDEFNGGGEEAFKARFDVKDYRRLRENAENYYGGAGVRPEDEERRESAGIGHAPALA